MGASSETTPICWAPFPHVTLRRLLGHTAGLTVHGLRGYAADERAPTLAQSLAGEPPANSAPMRVDLLPGSKWRYSDGGYNVLQQLTIDSTGRRFPEFVQALVLGPIGMTHSTFDQPLPAEWAALAASGHRANGEPITGRWHMYPEMAAAGLWTTPSDLARWAIEMQQSLRGRSNRVLSADMTDQMLTKQPGGHGLGLALGGDETVTTFSHGGANEGFRCILFAYLETGQGAVVMTNGDGGDGLFNEIMRAIASEYAWPDYRPTEKTMAKIDPAIYQSYVGQYDESQTPITIGTDRGQLYIAAAPFGQGRIRLYPSAADRFFVLEGTLEVSFHKDTQGRVMELQIHAGDQTARARKMK